MTARCLQNDAKAKGLPWTVAKGYDTFCPVSRFISKTELPDPHNATLWLKVNGKQRQHGSTSMMLFRIPQLISHISTIMTLNHGDLILTGTPEGVGQVLPGDVIEAGLDSLVSMTFPVVARVEPKL
jgi:acylpyruvate hydrolase